MVVVACLVLLLAGGCTTAPDSGAASAAGGPAGSGGAPTYAVEVAPILKEKCSACHGRLIGQKGLKLHTLAAVMKGGDSGPAVVPGSPESSPLYSALSLPDADPRHMPPLAGGQPLSSAEIATLRAWIAAGAR